MILKNQAQCLVCWDILESAHRHDFKTCQCSNLSVDGGKDYVKRSAFDPSRFREMTIYEDRKP